MPFKTTVITHTMLPSAEENVPFGSVMRSVHLAQPEGRSKNCLTSLGISVQSIQAIGTATLQEAADRYPKASPRGRVLTGESGPLPLSLL